MNYTLEMTEDEAKALTALVTYGSVRFLELGITDQISKPQLQSGSDVLAKIALLADEIKNGR